MSYMGQNFCLSYVSNLPVLSFRICLLMWVYGASDGAVAAGRHAPLAARCTRTGNRSTRPPAPARPGPVGQKRGSHHGPAVGTTVLYAGEAGPAAGSTRPHPRQHPPTPSPANEREVAVEMETNNLGTIVCCPRPGPRRLLGRQAAAGVKREKERETPDT